MFRSMRPLLPALILLVAGAAETQAVEKSAFKPAWVAEFLKSRLGLSPVELDRVARGETVTRMIEDRGDREIAMLGVITLPHAPQGWSRDFDLVQRIRRSNPDLIAIGSLGVPPRKEELAGAALDPKALPQIRKCRPEQCGLNLPTDAIAALKREADTAGADFEAKANAVFQETLRQIAHEYQDSGDGALPVFTNRTRLVPTADAPALLLTRKPSLAQLAPQLDRELRECPHLGRECPLHTYYWYREKSWKHEVVGLVQAGFEEEPIATGHYRALVEKVFYANHYFRSSLSVTGVLEDPAGSYLFYMQRSETDNGGAFNFIERALAAYLIPRRLLNQMSSFRGGIAPPTGGSAVTTP
jgi:hypothetical protein